LQDSDRSGANPQGTNPTGANPQGTNPQDTNRNGANPQGANSSGANPTGANPSDETLQDKNSFGAYGGETTIGDTACGDSSGGTTPGSNAPGGNAPGEGHVLPEQPAVRSGGSGSFKTLFQQFDKYSSAVSSKTSGSERNAENISSAETSNEPPRQVPAQQDSRHEKERFTAAPASTAPASAAVIPAAKPETRATTDEGESGYFGKGGQQYLFGKVIGLGEDNKKTPDTAAASAEQKKTSKIGHVSEYNLQEDETSKKEASERVYMMDLFADDEPSSSLNPDDFDEQREEALQSFAKQQNFEREEGTYDASLDSRDKSLSAKKSRLLDKNPKIEAVKKFESQIDSLKNRKINYRIEKGYYGSGTQSSKPAGSKLPANENPRSVSQEEEDDVYEISMGSEKDEK
jgi:hypothetical protein